MIDILIPTYNRASYVVKNIKLLTQQIVEGGMENKIKILVSDNYSADSTSKDLEELKLSINISLSLYKQKTNVGLERNTVFLLEKSTSEFVMFLGDDDFLPPQYLKDILDILENDLMCSLVIPGFSSLCQDGVVTPVRHENFNVKRYKPTFWSAFSLTHLGHQMSGLLIKRDGVLDKYITCNSLRNLYPFIFFVAFSALRGNSYYMPKFQVLVTQGNYKDWKYDDSGLLIDVLKNFRILFPHSSIMRFLLGFSIVFHQPIRLCAGFNPGVTFKRFKSIFISKDIDVIFKIFLPVLYPIACLKRLSSKLKRFF